MAQAERTELYQKAKGVANDLETGVRKEAVHMGVPTQPGPSQIQEGITSTERQKLRSLIQDLNRNPE